MSTGSWRSFGGLGLTLDLTAPRYDLSMMMVFRNGPQNHENAKTLTLAFTYECHRVLAFCATVFIIKIELHLILLVMHVQ